jgi:hypothetical protein
MSPLGPKAMMWSWDLLGAPTFVACADGLVVPRAFHASLFLWRWAGGQLSRQPLRAQVA